jgi:hypothetical protein
MEPFSSPGEGGTEMSAIDHIQPFIPTHRVRRTGEKGTRRDAGTGKEKRSQSKIPSEHKPDGRKHVVDELA